MFSANGGGIKRIGGAGSCWVDANLEYILIKEKSEITLWKNKKETVLLN